MTSGDSHNVTTSECPGDAEDGDLGQISSGEAVPLRLTALKAGEIEGPKPKGGMTELDIPKLREEWA